MKRNFMMRLASCILIAVILTTCITFRTYAKYVTSDSANDSARVAKWGVNIVVSGSLFSNAYLDKNKGNIPSSSWSTNYVNDHITVATSTDGEENIIAPGTKSDTGLSIFISGKPEVATKITVEKNENNSDIFLSVGSYGYMNKLFDKNMFNSLGNNQEKNSYINNCLNNYKDGNGKSLIYLSKDNEIYSILSSNNANFSEFSENDIYYFNRILTIEPVNELDLYFYPIVYHYNDKVYSRVQALYNDLNIDLTKTVKANTDLTTELGKNGHFNITWEWPYEINNDKNDIDIFLGNIAAKNTIDDNFVYIYDEGTGGNRVYLEDGMIYVKYGDYKHSIGNTTAGFGFSINISQVD